jgi:hypothetical protein
VEVLGVVVLVSPQQILLEIDAGSSIGVSKCRTVGKVQLRFVDVVVSLCEQQECKYSF